MVTAEAIIHAGASRFCTHNAQEHPLVLQLGGSDPQKLSQAVRAVQNFGFSEINLNIGCPSSRVQSGRFGACLMAEPHLVARCLTAMQQATDLPITIKCRIGIDDMDATALHHFIETQISAGLRVLYLHSRKALLKGLSPKDNRTIPPLDYARAAQLTKEYPQLQIILNGGLNSYADMVQIQADHKGHFAGMMLGRTAYKLPYSLATCEHHIFQHPPKSRLEIALAMTDYADNQGRAGVPLPKITRHILGLYAHTRGAKYWRRILGERAKHSQPRLIAQTAYQCEQKMTEWSYVA